MLFDRLSTDWADYRTRLAHMRALVVDDEPLICRVLSDLLSAEGFDVDTAGDAESGWEMIQQQTYDLLVTDKNLPGRSGVELIGRIKQAQIDLPSVMITGFASVGSIGEALRQGASDYIAKPFPDIRHVVRRLKAVADRRVSEKLYQRVIADLKSAAGGEEDANDMKAMARELFAFKQELQRRLAVLVVEPSITNAFVAADTVAREGLSVELARSVPEAQRRFEGNNPPLAIVLSLELPNVVAFIDAIKRRDPLLEVLVTSPDPSLNSALHALTSGASDFVNTSIEGQDILLVRALRLVEQARRQRLYLHLITGLLRRVKTRNPGAAHRLLAALPESQRAFLTDLTGPIPDIPEDEIDEPIELTDLLEEVEPEVEPTPILVNPAGPAEPPEPAELTEDDLIPIDAGDLIDLAGAGRGHGQSESERRNHERIPADLPVRYRRTDNGGAVHESRLRDISLSGMFILTDEVLPVGSRLRVEVFDSGGELVQPIITEGEVVRYIMMAPDPDSRSGVGIRILHVEGEHAYEALVRQISGREGT